MAVFLANFVFESMPVLDIVARAAHWMGWIKEKPASILFVGEMTPAGIEAQQLFALCAFCFAAIPSLYIYLSKEKNNTATAIGSFLYHTLLTGFFGWTLQEGLSLNLFRVEEPKYQKAIGGMAVHFLMSLWFGNHLLSSPPVPSKKKKE
jgi:hypothetical protein